jgi:ribosomal protein L40E
VDPLILYALLALGGLLLLRVVSGAYKGNQRRCPSCDAEVDVHARGCRHCGYRFGRV